ncbi:T9SS type A sorting domain-containing protein [Ulvibacter litoralis]|uniref:Por secretion system C-terminal sorting domain-containing protein n=1 Tax=Ulvibacter litoralis TaxID=227084 RepID=A0A1G7GF99_9FLAO|nr:T9SS type A sorting domain-containing protein [Ulvibacter litoralis]SDE86804.1 Por secretion system C-terminal sorting domain-containing protein [Ulvibacter litoralis]
MKNIIFLLMVFGLYSLQGNAQDPELLNNNWYLQYVVFDDVTYEMVGSPPGGVPFFSPHLQFEENEVSAILTLNYFFSDVTYDIPNTTFTALDPHVTLGSCESLCDLENVYLGSFYLGNGQAREFSYDISYNSDDSLNLTIYDAFGNRAVYWSRPYLLSVQNNELTRVTISPNPASESIQIVSQNNEINSVSVYSMEGKKMFVTDKDLNKLDVSSLDNGIYFLQILHNNGQRWIKFIKN